LDAQPKIQLLFGLYPLGILGWICNFQDMGILVVCSKKKIDILSLLLVASVTIFKSSIPMIIISFPIRKVRVVNPLESDAQYRHDRKGRQFPLLI
jgi:hypothetical protein